MKRQQLVPTLQELRVDFLEFVDKIFTEERPHVLFVAELLRPRGAE